MKPRRRIIRTTLVWLSAVGALTSLALFTTSWFRPVDFDLSPEDHDHWCYLRANKGSILLCYADWRGPAGGISDSNSIFVIFDIMHEGFEGAEELMTFSLSPPFNNDPSYRDKAMRSKSEVVEIQAKIVSVIERFVRPLSFGQFCRQATSKPNHNFLLQLPLWLPAVLLSIYPLLALKRGLRDRRRRRLNQCLTCGYSLNTLTGSVCPECGTAHSLPQQELAQ